MTPADRAAAALAIFGIVLFAGLLAASFGATTAFCVGIGVGVCLVHVDAWVELVRPR